MKEVMQTAAHFRISSTNTESTRYTVHCFVSSLSFYFSAI